MITAMITAIFFGLAVFWAVLAFWEHWYHTRATLTFKQAEPPQTIHLTEDEARRLMHFLPELLLNENSESIQSRPEKKADSSLLH